MCVTTDLCVCARPMCAHVVMAHSVVIFLHICGEGESSWRVGRGEELVSDASVIALRKSTVGASKLFRVASRLRAGEWFSSPVEARTWKRRSGDHSTDDKPETTSCLGSTGWITIRGISPLWRVHGRVPRTQCLEHRKQEPATLEVRATVGGQVPSGRVKLTRRPQDPKKSMLPG